ncbi:K+/H+ antiporter subunit F [Aureimonas endophytica]|uniref:K+/H+ antiporter subunit F n=1 Tax=Aureimonas endophytica TaxID=2027858 RepID=A0A917E9U7_9HYPH|nr:K+/H+ antiporter subunit F [Aureimonas endophytica]GGE17578.1 K+/H+ antiporter subunit F [Aureimonas endophytica]
MSAAILDGSILLAQIMLALACACCAYRIVFGPRAQDRILGLDAFYVTSMLILLTIGMRTGSAVYFDAALVIAIVGFVGTVALAKFLMRGEVVE